MLHISAIIENTKSALDSFIRSAIGLCRLFDIVASTKKVIVAIHVTIVAPMLIYALRAVSGKNTEISFQSPIVAIAEMLLVIKKIINTREVTNINIMCGSLSVIAIGL